MTECFVGPKKSMQQRKLYYIWLLKCAKGLPIICQAKKPKVGDTAKSLRTDKRNLKARGWYSLI